MRRGLAVLGFVAALALVFAAVATLLQGEAPSGEGNIRVLLRLDEYTRKSNPGFGNTIPTFLMQPGLLGALSAEAVAGPDDAANDPTAVPVPTTNDVRPVDETELRQGFCTSSLARLIRQQYPGFYDDMPDEELEKTVVKKRPEFKDRLCVLPVWINAGPHEIIKYEVTSSVLTIAWRWLWAALITAAVGAGGVVIYRLQLRSRKQESRIRT